MTVRETQQHFTEMYGAESIAFAYFYGHWQSRPLNAVYPVIYLDCIHAKVRDAGSVRTKAIYLAIGITYGGP